MYKFGLGRFDTVRFENVCRCGHAFKLEHIRLWLLAARDLLRVNGEIHYFSYCDNDRRFVKRELYQLGFSVRNDRDVSAWGGVIVDPLVV